MRRGPEGDLRASLLLGAGAAQHGVAEGAPGGDEEGHAEGEGDLPGKRDGHAAVEEERTLVDEGEDGADDESGEERAAEHTSVAQGAAEAEQFVAGGAAHPEEAAAGRRRGVGAEGGIGAFVQASSSVACAIPGSPVSSGFP